MTAATRHVAGIDLRRVLPRAEFLFGNPPPLVSCSCDSRDVLPGDLFVALVGTEHDGHDFAAQAIQRGAAGIVSERPLPTGVVPNCVVRDSRVAYGRMCHALVKNPSTRLAVVGVTGTNGKTTTACLIASVLEAAGARVGMLGTLGCSDGVGVESTNWTTPPAHVTARWLARMEAAGCSHAVMEISSHALAQRRTAGLRLDAACITNIRRDHLDFHGSVENYRAAKARIFHHLKSDGLAVLSADDPASRALSTHCSAPLLFVGSHGDGQLSASLIERLPSEQTFLLTTGSETVPVRTRMIGDHHVANCLQAATIGLGYGIDLATIVRGLEALERVPGRLERIERGQPFCVYVDYAHTPDALSAMLETLRQVTSGRVICLFGAGGNRDRQKRPVMGRAVEALADLAIVTSDNPRGEDPRCIITDILSGMDAPRRAIVEPDRVRAIHRALREAMPGDAVLVAGKGHEQHQTIGRRRYRLDDRKIVRDWLCENVQAIEGMGVIS